MSELIDALHNHTVRVRFVKKDGSLRDMLCTLQRNHIPTTATNGGERANKNPDVVSVWDIDAGAWRSFNRNSVLEYNVQPELTIA